MDERQPGARSPAMDRTPLIVDVDGTLLRTDLLHESLLRFVAERPLEAWRLPLWALGGRASLKCKLADRIDIVVERLPFNREVVSLIGQAVAAGRPVHLASAADERFVKRLAAVLDGVEEALGTKPGRNLGPAQKAEMLVERFGIGGFDYVGDRTVDHWVWRHARRVHVVARTRGIERSVHRRFAEVDVVARPRTRWLDYWRLLRTHQWSKNLLVFLSLVASHQFGASDIAAAVIAFICFCLAASSAYIINDLLDLPADRSHRRKAGRPFASGAVPVAHGPPLALLLLASAVALATLLPIAFVAVLLIYVAATLAYSLVLKRRMLIDVLWLAGLYTVRVIGGVAVAGAPVSPWLLMFSLFFFLSLAIIKRCAELAADAQAGKQQTIGRGYRVGDLSTLLALAAAAGFASAQVVGLYIASPEVQQLYDHPQRLWLVCPLIIYWLSRVLLIASRNELHDDPVVFAMTDRISWAVAATTALVLWMAS